MKLRFSLSAMAGICCGVVALVGASVAAADGAQQQDFPFNGLLFNPCNGEQVAAEGVFHNVVRVDSDASGGNHVLIHQNVHLSGVGLTTGDRYVLNATTDLGSYNMPFTTTVHQSQPFHFIAQGSSPNFTLIVRFHLTINHFDEVKSEFDSVTTYCQGEAAP